MKEKVVVVVLRDFTMSCFFSQQQSVQSSLFVKEKAIYRKLALPDSFFG